MTDPVSGLPQPVVDEALLDQLTEALRPRPLMPPPASMAALRRAVERKWRPTVRTRVMRQLTVWARRLQRTGAAVALFAGMAVGGTGVAVAAGGPIPPSVQYLLQDLGIPLPPAIYHDGRRPAHPPVNVDPQAARPSAPITPPRDVEPVAAAAVPEMLSVSVPSTTQDSSGPSTTARPGWTAPAAGYRDRPLGASRRSMASTGRTSSPGTGGACSRASLSAPGTASPAQPGVTASTAWPGATTTNSRRTGPDWSQAGAGDFAAAGRGYPTTRASSWYPRYRTASTGSAAYAPTSRDPHSDYGTGR
jgi:hypothetical protein